MFLKPHKIHLHLGLKRPIRILQLTDAHLSYADERNGEAMIAFAQHGRACFFKEGEYPERDPLGFLEEAMEYSKNFDCTVITGDLVNLNYFKSYEVAKEALAGKDYMFCAGNHEFSPKSCIDSYELKEATADYIQSYFRGNMFFESRIVGEVNVVTMDNAYHTWTEEQFAFLKAEVAKGLPILLFCHNPISTDQYAKRDYYDWSVNIGATEEMVQRSMEVVKYIAEEPAIKAIFTGHFHFTYSWMMNDKPVYILGALFKGIVGEIVVD